VEDHLAVHALCPVVVITAAPPAGNDVVVGWTNQRAGRLAMAEAACEASLRGTELTIIPEPAAFGAAQRLIEESRGAGLLVVGVHHSDDPWNIRTGPVTGELMRRALCPVMLVARRPGTDRAATTAAPEVIDPASVHPQLCR